ncbi:TPA: hypothetical protein ACK3RK_008542, partial [Burkholderia cepacia]
MQLGVCVSWGVAGGLCRAGRPCDGGLLLPVHDVVAVVRMLLRLSDAVSYRTVMPAKAAERFQARRGAAWNRGNGWRERSRPVGDTPIALPAPGAAGAGRYDAR